MNINNTLLTLATISTIYEIDQKDKTYFITPYIIKIIHSNYNINENVGISTIIKRLDEDFGLKNVPRVVIIRELKKLSKKPYLIIEERRTNTTFCFVKKDLELVQDFSAKENDAREKIELITREISNYLKEKQIEVDDEKICDSLFYFLESNGFEFIIKKEIVETYDKEMIIYNISRFVCNEINKGGKNATILLEIFKGVLLTNALYYSNNLFEKNKDIFKELVEVYLDTPLLLRAIGLKSEEENEMITPLFDLLPNNIKLKCFNHNVDEVENIIDNYISKRNTNGMTIEKFDVEGYDLDAISIFKETLRERLQKLNIEIDQDSSFTKYMNGRDEKEFKVDQADFESLLKSKIPSYALKDQMLEKDVSSILYINLMRKNKKVDSFKRCKSIFVTSNYGLVSCVKEYFKNNKISICISDIELITGLWLNYSSTSDSIPKKLMIGFSLASQTTHTTNFFEVFEKKIDKLKEDKQIDENAYTAYLFDYNFKQIILSDTNGDSSNIATYLPVAIEKYKESIILKEVPDVIAERDSLKKELEKLKDQNKERIIRQQDNAEKKAKIFSSIITYSVYAVIFGIILFLSLFNGVKSLIDIIKKEPFNIYVVIYSSLGIIVTALVCACDIFNKSRGISKRMKRKIYGWILKSFLKRIEVGTEYND